MSFAIASVLTIASEAFIGKLVGEGVEYIKDKLYVQVAYKRALGTAIDQYANSLENLTLAQPLLRKDGPLTLPAVAEELSQIVRFEREPDYEEIGRYWRDALESPPPWRDFTEEALLLVGYLEQELRSSEAFRPAFEAHDLYAIVTSGAESAELLAEIEMKLGGLQILLDKQFGDLAQAFGESPNPIRSQIRDFSRIIEEKTRGFVGRQWIFDKLERFIEENPRGYFFVVGDPGIGKSALASELIKRQGHVHHFNIRAEGVNKSATFLKNICTQLIAAYKLEYSILPPDADQDAGFLNKLLGEISAKLRIGDHCVIVVDALDEVDEFERALGTNLLYLPITLPQGVYFVVTMRDVPEIQPRVNCENGELRIVHNSTTNLDDVADYVTSSAARPGIGSYMKAQELEPEKFVAMMVEKSEGNFMYLRYVLPEIEKGAYRDVGLSAIPSTLKGYYEEHWQRMKGLDPEAWFDYKLPTIVGLTVAQEPISADQIAYLTQLRRSRVRSALEEWKQFLHEEYQVFADERIIRYRLYHLSFFEFVASKQVIEGEKFDLQAMHDQFAGVMLEDLLK